ncbi:lytic murein transglycosylase [Candidatus Azambacteria bacterium]|nr:lytic murein transglycosylase [Candidatus Azambacteria bacterium]
MCVYAGAAPALAQESAAESEKAQLQGQLKEVQEQIEIYRQSIEGARSAQKSLKGEITTLDTAVQKQKLQLKEIELILREVENDLKGKTKEISSLEGRLKEKRLLLQLSLKQLQEYDAVSWVGVLFSGESLSDFFNQVRYVKNIQADINDFIANIDSIRNNLEQEKADLEDEKEDVVRLKSLNSLQKSSLEQKQKEKIVLLEKTKGQEKLYNEGIKKSKKDITLIRQQLYTLQSVGVSMSFEEALAKTQFAGQKTGIRPAFLLAIFQVESKLGTYLGGGSWRVDMKPKERPLFLQVTSALGLDPDAMPVSKRPSYGWGGAMGAAQFIPSTWLIYADQIASLTGHNPPSPWDIEDAFVGSALKLVGNGAGSQAYKDEHKAAAMYLAGGNYKKKVAQAYANNVMDWADYYQGQVDALSGVSIKNISLSGS